MNNAEKKPAGAVLSDSDIKKMVEEFPHCITVDGEPIDFDDKQKNSLRPCCVDLTVGAIYTHKEKMTRQGQTLSLPPGGVAHIESKERFNMPDNIMGFLVPRNKYSERGLLMLNAGHVDPGWRDVDPKRRGGAYLTLEIINLREEHFRLTVGEDRPFSIVFHYMHTKTDIPTAADDDEKRRNKAFSRLESWPETLYSPYRDRIMKEVENTFATKEDLKAAEVRIEAKRIKGLTLVGVIAAAAAAMVGVIGLSFMFWQLTN